MSAKFTPGPWVVVEHNWSDTSVFVGDDKRICRLTIYDVATEETQESLEKEMDANARLIAAAPDLLEALEELCVQAEAVGAIGIYWDNARKAIAKAKGETP